MDEILTLEFKVGLLHRLHGCLDQVLETLVLLLSHAAHACKNLGALPELFLDSLCLFLLLQRDNLRSLVLALCLFHHLDLLDLVQGLAGDDFLVLSLLDHVVGVVLFRLLGLPLSLLHLLDEVVLHSRSHRDKFLSIELQQPLPALVEVGQEVGSLVFKGFLLQLLIDFELFLLHLADHCLPVVPVHRWLLGKFQIFLVLLLEFFL